MSNQRKTRRTLEQRLADEADALAGMRRSAVARRVNEAIAAVQLAQVSSGVEERRELDLAAEHLANALRIVEPPKEEPK